MFLRACILLSLLSAACAQDAKRILVVTAHAGDYLIGGGGTLAGLIDQGYEATVVQVTNDEKNSAGLGPAETQKANAAEGKEAAQLIGVREVIELGHKSGELGDLSSTELREEIFGLIRYFKPLIIFIPDPYIHFDENRDHFYAGKMAEEAWGYSGGGTFGPELARMALKPYGAPEVFYYAVGRPYRPGEGGEGQARFRGVDITSTFERKVSAVLALKTTNHLFAHQIEPRSGKEAGADALVRAYLVELAETIGKNHGFRYGEEFNHVLPLRTLPDYVTGRAVPKR